MHDRTAGPTVFTDVTTERTVTLPEVPSYLRIGPAVGPMLSVPFQLKLAPYLPDLSGTNSNLTRPGPTLST
jgi:hypothetical protein